LGSGYSNKSFNFGDVFLCKDSIINFPDSVFYTKKEIHDLRPVVIIQDNYYNNNPASRMITIAPVSSEVKDKTRFDLELIKDLDSVNKNCFLRLCLIQPVCKIELKQHVGSICTDRKYEVRAILIFYLGLKEQDDNMF
jgi:mRNA-degrading endonuclease toxin of MazEF toxin-antitoxin module